MKIFIFGANGMLGTYLFKYFSPKYQVVPVTRKQIDLTEDFSLISKNYDFEPDDVIINAAGIIKQRTYSPEELIRVNSLFPHFLSTLGCNVIHITTDCVFSGNDGEYNEDSLHDCLDDYGKSKSLGENLNLTIIRTSIIGEEIYNKKSLVEWVKHHKNSQINGYINHFWNGITCLELCKHIQEIILNGSYWKGVKHYFSPETVSKYQLVFYINEIYELNNKVIPIKSKYCDRSLNTKYDRSPVQISIKEQVLELKKFNIRHKLHNFPQVNVVNLKENEERRKVFSSTFSKYPDLNIIFHQYDRISEKKCSEIIFNNENIPYYVTNKLAFLGAITSHLSTIKTWYETTNEEYGFFCEDDLSLETVDYWNFNWEEFIDMLPFEWQTVQLSLTRSPEIFFKDYKNGICFKSRSWDDWSCVAYIIKRSHAKKIIENYYSGINFSLEYSGIDSSIRPKEYTDIAPENIIYTSFEYDTNYIFPLFVPNYDFDSVVWDKLDEKNNPSEIIDWWKNVGKTKTLQELFGVQ